VLRGVRHVEEESIAELLVGADATKATVSRAERGKEGPGQASRPASCNFRLFLNVFSAMILVGGLAPVSGPGAVRPLAGADAAKPHLALDRSERITRDFLPFSLPISADGAAPRGSGLFGTTRVCA
jgi:hypothetical protein